MKFARFLVLLAAAGAIQAQTWDTSGNSMLNGTYYFRQVYYVIGDEYGDLSEAVSIYGNISFDGNGNYSIASAKVLDSASGSAIPQNFTTTGTYSIASSGYGFLSSPYDTSSGGVIYGLVSATGIFVGSTTDNSLGYNDMMVAAPLASPAPTASSFSGSWTFADFDLSSGNPEYALSSMFSASPSGSGTMNTGTISGYAGVGTQLYTETASGMQYTVSAGAFVTAFPSSGNLIVGTKYLYLSKDGNFMFGGSPTSFDMIVGIKTTSGTQNFSGLYYQAGFDEYEGDLDSYFGSFDAIAGAAPQTIVGHERLNNFGGSATGGGVSDYTYDDTISLSGNTFSNTYARYVVGDGGATEITSGKGPFLGLSVALQGPTVSGSGVFLNPTGVVNSASYAPFTASIAPGELLTLYGSNLADNTTVVQGGIPFPASLGNVQVNIGGYPAPIYYVSPTAISAIVPYEVTPGSIVQIQVMNDIGSSNVVTEFVSETAPGVFTQNAGTGYGLIVHLGIGNSVSPVGSLVSDANPAVEGETVLVYLTGLGPVSPAITDGAPGPTSPTSGTTNTIAVDIGGTTVTNDFAGLSPGYAGLYQLNITLPATGLTAGPNFLDIAGPDSYMGYLLIPVAATPPSTAAAAARTPVPAKFRKGVKGSPSLRRK